MRRFFIVKEGFSPIKLAWVTSPDDGYIHGLRTPRESFFQKLETLGLGQTNWAEI